MGRLAGLAALALVLGGAVAATGFIAEGGGEPPTGVVRTVSTSGGIDASNPFFQTLGTNGRSCSSCHPAGGGWTVTPPLARARFAATGGLDPIFRSSDGATCPTADVSTVEARRGAYRLLLTKGLIRVALRVPAEAEFRVLEVENPYGCRDALGLSLYRRPLPATNLRFLTTVMWDEQPRGVVLGATGGGRGSRGSAGTSGR